MTPLVGSHVLGQIFFSVAAFVFIPYKLRDSILQVFFIHVYILL
jgi:hypothetical protein